MSKFYSALMSPLKVGGRVAKTRFLYPCALPHFLQGPESFPAEPMIDYYAKLAQNGAAILIFHDITNPHQRQSPGEDGRRFAMYDPTDPAVENYYCQLNDNVRYYGGLMTFELFQDMLPEYEVVDMDMAREQRDMLKLISPDFYNNPKDAAPIFGFMPRKGFTEEAMEELIRQGVEKCRRYKGLGFAGCAIEVSRGRFGSFMDIETNTRADRFGGSTENRAAFMVEIMRRLKAEVGQDFLIIGNFSSLDYNAPYEDKVKYLRLLEPYMDLIHIRSGIAQTGYDGKSSDYLRPQAMLDSQELKAAGVKTPICAWTGFQDPGLMDEAVRDGKLDMISCARMFIANPDMGRILREGRGEDLVPCVLCNKCHGVSMQGDWLCACTVNPKLGLEHRLHKLRGAPGAPKKVAVIGGGPVGMRAALFARAEGHAVTLFEKTGELGGQLRHAVYPSFKWPMARYIDWLKKQVEKQGVDLRLNSAATPGAIRAEGFDAVIAATGAVPKKPDIPGAENVVWNPQNIYDSEKKLGRDVVCIGGSESSVEAGLYLAERGHRVTLLTRQEKLLHDANPIHYPEMVMAWARKEPNFKFVLRAAVREILPGKVVYRDRDGAEHTLACDDVVASGGVEAQLDAALAFADAADLFFVTGDASGTGNLWRGNRDAFAAVSRL